jgi:hypothetical protein
VNVENESEEADMKRTTVLATVLAVIGLVAVPAHAAPWQQTWLPDADLFCEDADGQWVDVGRWVGNPNAASLWIADGGFAGHHVIVTAEHYLEFGVAAYEPRDDFAGTILLGTDGFGHKRGVTDRASCQVVSRFPGPVTVYAPLELARTP